MGDSLVTRPSLLVRIRDVADAEAWSRFVEVYGPLIYGFARKQGLQDADAADLVQNVLRSVSTAIGRLDYDARLGSFRGWLFTIARNHLHDFHARRPLAVGTGDSGVQQLLTAQPQAESNDEAEWNAEYRRRTFAWAAEQVRRDVHETTWLAFWKTAVEGAGAKETATELGMSVAAVYLAKSRVMARIKEQVHTLHDETEPQ